MAHHKPSPLEELTELDRKIEECEQRILEHEQRIEASKFKPRDIGEVARLHENLLTSLSVLWELRELVKKEVEDARR